MYRWSGWVASRQTIFLAGLGSPKSGRIYNLQALKMLHGYTRPRRFPVNRNLTGIGCSVRPSLKLGFQASCLGDIQQIQLRYHGVPVVTVSAFMRKESTVRHTTIPTGHLDEVLP